MLDALSKVFGKSHLGLVLIAFIVLAIQAFSFAKEAMRVQPETVKIEVERNRSEILTNRETLKDIEDLQQIIVRTNDRQTLILERLSDILDK